MRTPNDPVGLYTPFSWWCHSAAERIASSFAAKPYNLWGGGGVRKRRYNIHHPASARTHQFACIINGGSMIRSCDLLL